MISEQWLDMYHRARSAGMTHATAMKILVDPEDLSEREAVIAQLSKQPAFHSAPLVEFTKEALLWMEAFPGMIPTFKLSLDDARKMVSFEKKAAEETLRKMKDIDAGFNTWWESYGKCMTNDRTPHEMAWRDGYLAGQKAKP